MRKTSWIAGIVVAFAIATSARADEIEVPAWTPEPPAVSAGPALPAVADRFTPNDVAAPAPPGVLYAPGPPAFDRFSCDTFTCGGGRGGASLGVIESPATPGELPGFDN